MSALDLDAIEVRASIATQGPWGKDGCDVFEETSEFGDVIAECGLSGVDADFIAHARADVPALVARVRELEATVARVEDLAAEWDQRSVARRNYGEPDSASHAATELRAILTPHTPTADGRADHRHPSKEK